MIWLVKATLKKSLLIVYESLILFISLYWNFSKQFFLSSQESNLNCIFFCRTNQPRVSDYTITHLAQCDGELGVCPDSRLGGSNDAVVGMYYAIGTNRYDIFFKFYFAYWYRHFNYFQSQLVIEAK